MKRIAVFVPEQVLSELKVLRMQEGRPVAELIREALVFWLINRQRMPLFSVDIRKDDLTVHQVPKGQVFYRKDTHGNA